MKRINLVIYARKRGLIKNGIIGLDGLVEICLNENLEKAPNVCLGNWSKLLLSDDQIIYAALDVMKTFEVFRFLHMQPDLTKRMKKKEATPGTMVGMVPMNGNVSNMATRAAFGKIYHAMTE